MPENPDIKYVCCNCGKLHWHEMSVKFCSSKCLMIYDMKKEELAKELKRRKKLNLPYPTKKCHLCGKRFIVHNKQTIADAFC